MRARKPVQFARFARSFYRPLKICSNKTRPKYIFFLNFFFCLLELRRFIFIFINLKFKTELIHFLEKNLCGRLGGLNASCVQYMEAYGKTILYELGQKVNPSVICHQIGLCATRTISAPVVEQKVNTYMIILSIKN